VFEIREAIPPAGKDELLKFKFNDVQVRVRIAC
jgi:hypothetical protein